MTKAAHGQEGLKFEPVGVAILVVSDTRTLAEDTSGKLLADGLCDAGHRLVKREVVKDDATIISRTIFSWANEAEVDCILVTGGTGMSPRDVTPDALEPLFEKPMPGFGELFRSLSFQEIGTATLQSRATAGLIKGRPVFVLPGSGGACRLALMEIILPQLDSRTKPCSFPALWKTWGKPGETKNPSA
jgi:molybdenum cofactor biosynthesis protein B